MAGFKDIIGNEHIISHFEGAIENNKISHAYIINGEKGMGKKSVAKAFAMTLLCENSNKEPCLKCHSCIQALTDNNPDIITVTHSKQTVLAVDEIREQLVNDITTKPYSYGHKVYIIPDAQLMNVQAQNAMLKTIEEPPEYAVILLLTTNSEVLLPTVLSRCVTLNMQPVKKEDIKEFLMKEDKIVDYQTEVAVAFAGGNLGRARELAVSKDFSDMLDEVVQLLKYIKEMECSEVISAVKNANEYKFRFTEYIDLMILWFRDVLLYKASMDVDKLIYRNELSTIKKQAASSSYNGIENILKSMEKTKIRLKSNVNFDIAIELMFLTIRENI